MVTSANRGDEQSRRHAKGCKHSGGFKPPCYIHMLDRLLVYTAPPGGGPCVAPHCGFCPDRPGLAGDGGAGRQSSTSLPEMLPIAGQAVSTRFAYLDRRLAGRNGARSTARRRAIVPERSQITRTEEPHGRR